MNKILKYPLFVSAEQIIELPLGAEILALRMQGIVPTIWAKVDPERHKVATKILMLRTGFDQVFENWEYLGTIETSIGEFYHYYLELY